MILSNVLYNDSVKKNRVMLNLKHNIYWTNIDKITWQTYLYLLSPNATVNSNPLSISCRVNEGQRDMTYHYSFILLSFFFLYFSIFFLSLRGF
jgi:hypothetical protein